MTTRRTSRPVRIWWQAHRAWDHALQPIGIALPRHRAILGRFALWLRDVRGLQPCTIEGRLRLIREFLRSVARTGATSIALKRLQPARIERFFVAYSRGHGLALQQSMRTALRSFLMFGSELGWVERDMMDAVPQFMTYQLSTVPMAVSDRDIAAAIEVITPDTPARARRLALMLLFATYGVRRGQLMTLQLQDIDWEARTIHFRAHKGGKPVTHALTPAVAAALARYVDRFRPKVPFEEVFLRVHRPYLPISPIGISTVVHKCLERVGAVAPWLGPHTLRHAFASRLLRTGQSLKAVADLLGHRDLTSANVYAKVDVAALRQVAAEWPLVRR